MTSHASAHHHVVVPKLNASFESTPFKAQATSVAHKAASSGSGTSILRTVVGLVIVIAVIYGLTWVIRKLKGKDLPAAGEGMERIASLNLGANKSVALVRVGAELHLIGVGEHAITPIRSFSEDEAIDLGLPVTPPGTTFTVDARDGNASTALVPSPRTGRSRGMTLDSLKRMTQR